MIERHETLLAAYFADQIAEEEKAELLSLLDTDQELKARFREMEEAYVAACIPAFEKTKDADYERLLQQIPALAPVKAQKIRKPVFWKAFAAAASIAAVAFLGAALYSGHKLHESEQFIAQSDATTISSTRGTGTETLLPDGTRVHLNAASSLSFNKGFGRKTRDVVLEGEGFFEVAGDASKPFRVHSGNVCVTVKGTVFNVRNYADESDICVSLLEGAVLLTSQSGQVDLTPGKSAVVSRENGRIRLQIAETTVSDWTKGKIVFTDKSIPEILGYVQRNYGVHFIYDEGIFDGERFTGNISSSLSIDEILTYIDVDHKYRWQRQDDTITIHKK